MTSSATFFLPAAPGGSPGSSKVLVFKPRRWLDPQTRDYVVDKGDFKQDDGFTSQVVLALATRLGSCQVLPTFGSRLHEIKYADERGRRLAERFAMMALAHLASDIRDLKVTATTPQPGVIQLEITGRNGNRAVRVPFTAKAAA